MLHPDFWGLFNARTFETDRKAVTVIPHLRQALAAVFIAIVSAVFAISFAAIIYTGDLAPYFDRGIGLTLMGSVVLATVGAFVLSYRGTIAQPQDAPAILLAGGVAALVADQQLSGEVLFSTVACMVAVAAFATGVVAMAVGQLRLAMLARYIPYPVLAGFLAATGLLLLVGSIGVAVGFSLDAQSIAKLLEIDALYKWVPVCIAAFGIVIATRVVPGPFTLPLALLVAMGGFYLIIAQLGLTAEQAREAGFLLGPFGQGGFYAGVSPQVVGQADWFAIASQAPLIVTTVCISLIGAALNASGLELEVGRDIDINKDMRGAGLANALGALVGGLPGYHLLGNTILAKRLDLTGPVAGLSSAVGCFFVLVLGGGILSVMPTGFFAAVVAYLGVDLLYTWLWKERRNLSWRDFAIVLVIPVIAITFSFLMAIAVGLLLAFCFFGIAYAGLDVIRSQTSLALRRSFVERPDDPLRILAKAGLATQIIELSGYLFFASASALRDRVQTLLRDGDQTTDWLVIDFKHVSGVDSSTWHMLQRLSSECAQGGTQMVLCGNDRLLAGDGVEVLSRLDAQSFSTLDEALEQIEDKLLTRYEVSDHETGGDIFAALAAIFPADGFDAFVQTIHAKAGDVVLKAGSAADDIYILSRGRMNVAVTGSGGNANIVAQIRTGSLIGEMSYYTKRVRSADVIALEDVEVMRIDMAQLEALSGQDADAVAKFHKLIAGHIAQRLSRTTLLLRDLGF